MKTCEVCGRKVSELVPVMMMGPRGFRRYQVCAACQERAAKNKKPTRPAPLA